MTVDDGNLLGLWDKANKATGITITSGEGLTGYSSLSSPASSEWW